MSISEDILAMIELLNAERRYGPYYVFRSFGSEYVTDRRKARRVARRTGTRFTRVSRGLYRVRIPVEVKVICG